MVVVSREPETEPMLSGNNANNQLPQIDVKRKNSYPEETYKLITR